MVESTCLFHQEWNVNSFEEDEKNVLDLTKYRTLQWSSECVCLSREFQTLLTQSSLGNFNVKKGGWNKVQAIQSRRKLRQIHMRLYSLLMNNDLTIVLVFPVSFKSIHGSDPCYILKFFIPFSSVYSVCSNFPYELSPLECQRSSFFGGTWILF